MCIKLIIIETVLHVRHTKTNTHQLGYELCTKLLIHKHHLYTITKLSSWQVVQLLSSVCTDLSLTDKERFW